MKQNDHDLNLRGAFRNEPESCHQALMNAVRSVNEEEKKTMKHTPSRALLIAAIIIMSTLTVAFAANELLGLKDFFQIYGITLTPSTQQAMHPDEQSAFQLGPMTFTVQERMADPYHAYLSTRVSTSDGSQALICSEVYERVGAYDVGKALAAELGFDAKLTWLEAAAALGRPLYAVCANMELDENICEGWGMEAMLWDAQHNGIFINEVGMKNVTAGADLNTTLFLRVAQIDPATGEEIDKWISRVPYTLPVSPLLAEGVYTADAPVVTDGMTLTSLNAELYTTGAYIHRSYQVSADTAANPKDFQWDSDHLMPLTDENGTPFDEGISLSARTDTDAWPAATYTEMLNLNELPQIIQVGGVNYTLQTR